MFMVYNSYMKIEIIKKQKYQYGTNTLALWKGRYYLLSSMRMLNGTTTYNLYISNSDMEFMETLLEDYYGTYYELLNYVKGNY